jgi:hypothetical protein
VNIKIPYKPSFRMIYLRLNRDPKTGPSAIQIPYRYSIHDLKTGHIVRFSNGKKEGLLPKWLEYLKQIIQVLEHFRYLGVRILMFTVFV